MISDPWLNGYLSGLRRALLILDEKKKEDGSSGAAGVAAIKDHLLRELARQASMEAVSGQR